MAQNTLAPDGLIEPVVAPPAPRRPWLEEFRDDEPPPANNFAFTPWQLHRLLTLRTLAALDAFGGVRGLAAGLRTDTAAGLGADETNLDGTVSFEEAVAAGRQGRQPTVQSFGQTALPAAVAPAPAPSSSPTPAAPPPPPQASVSAAASTPVHHALRIVSDAPSPSFIDRRRIFGSNLLPRRHHKSFLRLMLAAFNDKLLILLSITAFISLTIGLYQTFTAEGGSIEWVDGVTVVAAVIVIILASAANDWQQNHKFEKLNERKDQRDVTVFRSGKACRVLVNNVLVGDVLHIEAGQVIAVDGVLISATGLHIDESSVSGEQQLVHKTVPSDHDALHAPLANPFILSGTTVIRGVGRYLVTAVGSNSTHGRTLMSLRQDVPETPLQAKLARLGKQLIAFGAIVGSIFFVVLFIWFIIDLTRSDSDLSKLPPTAKAEAFFDYLMISIALVIITVPEGLALNATIALAFATKRMLRDNNLVRRIRSCEIMGNATCICSDKTGTLTQNKMTVVAGCIGLDGYFDDVYSLPPLPSSAGPSGASARSSVESASQARIKRPDTSARLADSLSRDVRVLIKDSIALNSTAFESDETVATSDFFGSSTEMALLKFSRDSLGMGLLREERANSNIVNTLPFDSSRKWMATLVKLSDARYRLLVKGAAEIVFEYCAFAIGDVAYELTAERLEEEDRTKVRECIRDYAERSLRPVAIACRDLEASDVFESPDDDPASVNLDWLTSGLTFVGLFGICDPLRPEVVESVRICQNAGVFVRMVTGDNFLTAKAVAAECGIYTPGGIAMDGPTFRRLLPAQLDEVIPRLQVLARSSPEDKLLLVTHLRGMKETVAVTGDGTNDALALRAADVGFAMGVQGTEVAKEAASIILLDDNFASIVKALGWGRTVNDAVKKFCQFEFTINITAGIITIVSTIAGDGDSIFSVVQLLWINLIMDVFASLGLATDQPSAEFLKRKPEPRNSPIISITMWKMILGQAVYQLAVVLAVHYSGWDTNGPQTRVRLQTFVFNIYVWMQFFNQYNCRRVDNKFDLFLQNPLRNPWFMGVQLITVAGQIIIVFKGGKAFETEPLTGEQWGWSMLFGVSTIVAGLVIRCIPDCYASALFHFVWRILVVVTMPLRPLCTAVSQCMSRLCAWWRRCRCRFRRRRPKGHGVVLALADDAAATAHADLKGAVAQSPRQVVGSAASDYTDAAAAAERRIDLRQLVDASRAARPTPGDVLEVHPNTRPSDPVLGPRANSAVPPSQDDSVLCWTRRQPQEAQRRGKLRTLAEWVEPARSRRKPLPKIRGVTVDDFLRSKRR
ncbi:hypothetical protein CDD82_5691 [Ophiocordyceps australis]|uniref:Calcium-transporting ATPase n=1 Tax=Ophiocordyceps australis TaxID=1399860 RepID=A0A2C5YZH9_9HYPO|nr:hypothetical protein CDD82_5691 [Ophiocordyceps australis]